MELIFEGYRLAESDGRGVKFLGHYIDENSLERFVICRVTRSTLESLVKQDLTTAAELVAAYSRESTKINQLASVQFSSGVERPEVTGVLANGRTEN
jgi:hypothetical protein